MRAPASLILAIALAACAEVRWTRPGADGAAPAQDLSACRKLAQEKVTRMYGPPTPVVHDPRFGKDGMQPSPAERQMLQSQAEAACMREKGYTLTTSPDGSPAAPSGAVR
jgi:hypothetical protein